MKCALPYFSLNFYIYIYIYIYYYYYYYIIIINSYKSMSYCVFSVYFCLLYILQLTDNQILNDYSSILTICISMSCVY